MAVATLKPRDVFGPNDHHLMKGPDGKALPETKPGLGPEEEAKIRRIRAEQAGVDFAIDVPDAAQLLAEQEKVTVKLRQLSRAEEELEKERALMRARETEVAAREKALAKAEAKQTAKPDAKAPKRLAE